MSEQEPFLQAIAAVPDDDTRRLVYADWLDEHGDPERAEFIRLQYALSQNLPDTHDKNSTHKRAADLFAEKKDEWFGKLTGLPVRLASDGSKPKPRPAEVEIGRGFEDTLRIRVPDRYTPTPTPAVVSTMLKALDGSPLHTIEARRLDYASYPSGSLELFRFIARNNVRSLLCKGMMPLCGEFTIDEDPALLKKNEEVFKQASSLTMLHVESDEVAFDSFGHWEDLLSKPFLQHLRRLSISNYDIQDEMLGRIFLPKKSSDVLQELEIRNGFLEDPELIAEILEKRQALKKIILQGNPLNEAPDSLKKIAKKNKKKLVIK